MNLFKRFILLSFTLLCVLTSSLKAEVWTPETLPMVHLQDSLRFVCNPDGVLSATTVQATDAILNQLKQKKGVETVVVVVKKLENADAYQFGMELSRKYGIGDKQQRTGLIIILSTEDRKYQFLTGHGLEGTLPDGLCYNIQQAVMVPALKKGEWDKAIFESVKAVSGVIMGDESITRHFKEKSDDTMTWILVAIVTGIILFLASIKSAMVSLRVCPKCKGKNALELISSHRVRKGNRWYTRSTWICKKCGHTVVKEEEDPHDNHHSSNSALPPFFMMGGRGGGGGGFSGGSFGGGSFGGGGSGGDF